MVKCTKTLKHGDGSTSFIKGKEYEVVYNYKINEITEHTHLLNEQGEKHKLGLWAKHFKIV